MDRSTTTQPRAGVKHVFVLALGIQRIRIVDHKPQPRRRHFLLELELQVQSYVVAPQPCVTDGLRGISKQERESQPLGVESHRRDQTARAENRLNLSEPRTLR